MESRSSSLKKNVYMEPELSRRTTRRSISTISYWKTSYLFVVPLVDLISFNIYVQGMKKVKIYFGNYND